LEGLWVSNRYRGKGIGKELFQNAAREAQHLGAKCMYVSAFPSRNAVDFYLKLGCKLAEPVDEEQYQKEPEDIHLEKVLSGQ
jgi:GNAT superfamily N-acetyltransferase